MFCFVFFFIHVLILERIPAHVNNSTTLQLYAFLNVFIIVTKCDFRDRNLEGHYTNSLYNYTRPRCCLVMQIVLVSCVQALDICL